MKTRPAQSRPKVGAKKPAKLPRPYVSSGEMLMWQSSPTYMVNDESKDYPVAVLPCATLKSARALVKWAKLNREEKVEKLAMVIHLKDRPRIVGWYHHRYAKIREHYYGLARAVMSAMEGKQ